MADFRAVDTRHGATVVVELHGRLDGSAADRMADLRSVLEGPGVTDMVVDFDDVDYVNSTGIALIVGLAATARAVGRPVAVCGLSDHYEHIFRITRLADFVAIHPDRATAMGPGTAHTRPIAPTP